MTWTILHHGAIASLATSEGIVPAAALPAFDDALALLAGLEAVRAESVAAGHAEGFAAGRAAAAAEQAAALVALDAQVAAARAELRGSAAGLAVAIVRRIATGLGSADVVAALAARAAEDLAPDRPAEARVPPAALAATVARLGNRPQITVVADPALAADDCVLATPLGSVHAGLETQLAAVERALADAG